MAKIPIYEKRVGISTPSVQAGNVLATPKESFGFQNLQSQENLGQSLANAGKTLNKIALKKAQQNEEKAALKKELDFKGVMNDALYSPEIESIEENGEVFQRPKGFLNRRLSQTKDSALEFDERFRALYDETTDGISDYQKSLLHQALLSNYDSSRNAIIQHQAREEAKDYEQTFNATIEQIISDSAAYENPDDVNAAIDRITVMVTRGMRQMGSTDENVILRKVQETVAKIADNNISALLEKNPDKANTVFNEIKDKLPADVREVLSTKIDDKQFTMKRTAVWEGLSEEHRFENGSYDLEAFRNEIDELPGFNTKQKDQLYNYVEGRARDAEQAFKKSQAANYKGFLTEAIQLQKAGSPYDEVLAVATKFAADPVERKKMENDIRKMYDNTPPNPAIYTMLYTDYLNATLTETRLGDFKDELSAGEFKTLSKGLVDQIVNPKSNIAYKESMATIKVMLDKKFGSNKQKKDDFLLALFDRHEKEGGGSPDKLLQNASDLMEKVQINPWLPFIKKPKFEAKSAKIREDRDFKATLENDIGRDFVQKIGRGMMMTKGSKTFSADDIREFVDKFGGYDKVQPGTEAYRAIKILIDNKKLVTPESVEFVIDKLKKQ